MTTELPNPSAQQSVEEATAASAIGEFVLSHIDLVKDSSRVMVSDARLAVASVIQMLLLGLLALLIVFSLWCVVIFSLAQAMLWLGLPVSLALFALAVLHLLALGGLTLAIRSTFAGLRFQNTQSLFHKSSE